LLAHCDGDVEDHLYSRVDFDHDVELHDNGVDLRVGTRALRLEYPFTMAELYRRAREAEQEFEALLGLEEPDTTIVESLRSEITSSDLRPDMERSHPFRPSTWRPWLSGSAAALSVLDDFATDAVAAGGRVNRRDLVDLSRAVDERQSDSLLRSFVATMLWGSGTTNGRGPRYTCAALEDDRLIPSLVRTRQLILDGDAGGAYSSFLSRGIGPAFFTKWFWVAGLDRGLDPTPLILDARVWASLGALGWDSREAAGSRRWPQRYVAYLQSMERWANADLPGIDTSEQLEQVLFTLAGA
jgi:hypothetical protein